MNRYQFSNDPEPVSFSGADHLDNDTYGLDCRDNMNGRGTTIQDVALVEVTRRDRVPMADGDLVVSAVAVVDAGVTVQLPRGPVITTAGMFVSWKASGGNPAVGYRIKLAFTLTSGDVINRTVNFNVPRYVG